MIHSSQIAIQYGVTGVFGVIILPRMKPHKLEVCEVLKRRLGESNELLEDIHTKTLLGYEGECYADRYWEDLRLEIPFALFHSLEITHNHSFHHQIDTLFICQHFLLIVELKYIARDLSYNSNLNQFWRTYQGQILPLRDPFAQLARHEYLFSKILHKMKIDLPIVSAVIVSAKSAFLNDMPSGVDISGKKVDKLPK